MYMCVCVCACNNVGIMVSEITYGRFIHVKNSDFDTYLYIF